MKRPRARKRIHGVPWLLGGILLGATLDQLSVTQITVTRHLGVVSMFDEHDAMPAESNANNDIRIAFSTGCSPSQNWQSYVFFYHAMLVKQPGEITRIASGCTEAEQQDLARRHKEEVVGKMSNKFHIHFTPDYSRVGEGKSYYYYNKPFGLLHWMQHALGFPTNRVQNQPIIAVLDPDMILLKPLLNNFSALPMSSWIAAKPKSKSDFFVRRGHPIAQQYSYMAQWKLGLGDNIVGILGNDSPVYNFSKYDATYHFPAGPPYFLNAWDLFDIVVTWSAIAPAVHKNYPNLLAEMYAYSIAAAHHQLKHQLTTGLMVSHSGMKEEGWGFLKDISSTAVCGGQNAMEQLPHILHYCQEYSVGDYHFTKYYIPNKLLSCEAPLLLEPPREAAVRFNTSRDYLGKIRVNVSAQQSMRHAYMTCTLLAALNQAATFYKQQQCGPNANYRKTWTYFNVSAT